ncbi:MAG: hypothetical protein J6I56_04065 [Lachnospiraceae bacterium]|nr:hypothetical protein [Lachnospiraceae bacterium]
MKKFLRRLKQMPLFILLLFSTGLLSLTAYAGKDKQYGEYETDPVSEPFCAVVFQGLKDGIYPWDILTGRVRTNETEEHLEALLSQLDAEGAGTAAAPKVTDNREPSQEQEETTEPEEPADTTASGEEEEAQQESTSPVERIPDAETWEEDEYGSLIDPENPTHLLADSMPENVNHKVMPAVDYGVANRQYMVADDTVFNTDKAGLFAQNGEYYTFREVNDVYFSDALVIGDSRTVGLREYGDLRPYASVLAKESLNVYNLFTKTLDFTTPDGTFETTTLLDLLLSKQYRKVYLSVGINELGIPDTQTFYQKYREALGVIRQLQPDAIIYIQGIMHVSKQRSSTDKIFNNTCIVQRNTAIASLANGHDIFYLDMNPEFCDENGDLYPELSADGIHLKASAYSKWHEFLLNNAIYRDEDDYLGTGPIEEGVKIPGVTVPLEEEGGEESGEEEEEG